LPPARERFAVYGFAVVNDRGRVAAQPIMQAMGWQPGAPLDIRETAGLILVTADPDGTSRVTGEGHLRIPALVRHWCGLTPNSRVLLVAEPPEGRLVVHAAASLDAMVTREYTAIFGGDPA
jgi:bifunctional DNA-binding transcriptional regulator/antitoxin component of YhaV-PrlF toxin-antitoxin module